MNPDLDAIKASGQNSDAHSREMIAQHERRERRVLHSQLWAKWLRDNPSAAPADIQAFAERAVEEVGL